MAVFYHTVEEEHYNNNRLFIVVNDFIIMQKKKTNKQTNKQTINTYAANNRSPWLLYKQQALAINNINLFIQVQ